MKNLSISNNRLENLTVNNFFTLYSLESLDLSSNQITTIEMNTFQNLNKLLSLDLSNNIRLYALDSYVFRGLSNLKDLRVEKFLFKLETESFNSLQSISNIYLNGVIVQDNECLLMQTLKRDVVRRVGYNGSIVYYRSINLITSSLNSSCDIKLLFLQSNIHLDLKTDFQFDKFYERCNLFLIKNENSFTMKKNICGTLLFNNTINTSSKSLRCATITMVALNTICLSLSQFGF